MDTRIATGYFYRSYGILLQYSLYNNSSNTYNHPAYLRSKWTHGNNHVSMKCPRCLTRNICVVHGNCFIFVYVTNIQSSLDHCIFERERATYYKCYEVVSPIFRYILNFFFQYTVFVYSISWAVTSDINIII